jgi:hypothetical protein
MDITNDDFIIVYEEPCLKSVRIIRNLNALCIKYFVIYYSEDLKIKQPRFQNLLKRVSKNNICFPMVFHKFKYINNISEYLEELMNKKACDMCKTLTILRKDIIFPGYEKICIG